MISGFNTDIDFDGTVYHVQTEDKGAPSRQIMTLVYDGGTILASKRAGYDDLAASNFDERELAERVSRQHKLMCAAVKAGRIHELKEMTAKSSAVAKEKANAEKVTSIVESVPMSSPIPTIPVTVPSILSERPNPQSLPLGRVETEKVIRVAAPDLVAEEMVIDDVEIIEDIEIYPAEAVEVVSELSGQERPSNTKLSLELLGETKFKGGDRRTVNIMICRGTDRKVVPGSQIMIKILGSSFRPVIFHAKSDANGLAKVHLQVPHFQAGRAALLVRAMTGGEEVELRRVVTPG